MNSDPYDSAAWRSFGMLDADESALFAEAMRHDPGLRRACCEMDRLSAAIAATASTPVVPSAGDLERLRRSAGLPHEGRKSPLWPAVSGWAAALLLAAWTLYGMLAPPPAEPRAAHTAEPPAKPPAKPSVTAADPGENVETLRLSREIEDLRRNIEEFQQRERELYQILPGRALQIVMTMLPPGLELDDRTTFATPAMLGDALAAINRHPDAMDAGAQALPPDGQIQDHVPPVTHESHDEPPIPTGPPMAIPIYDAIRDAGTLVVSNLPPAGEGNAYHLWVVTHRSPQPVFIGLLPESSATGADAFDFGLGSTLIMPTAFLLTLDPVGSHSAPSAENTVLAGPPEGMK